MDAHISNSIPQRHISVKKLSHAKSHFCLVWNTGLVIQETKSLKENSFVPASANIKTEICAPGIQISYWERLTKEID